MRIIMCIFSIWKNIILKQEESGGQSTNYELDDK